MAESASISIAMTRRAWARGVDLGMFDGVA